MTTIVEYTGKHAPMNSYPGQIVSPPSSSPCCFAHMEQIGGLEQENGWPFVYRRCTVCGFTVRSFLSASALDLQLLRRARELAIRETPAGERGSWTWNFQSRKARSEGREEVRFHGTFRTYGGGGRNRREAGQTRF